MAKWKRVAEAEESTIMTFRIPKRDKGLFKQVIKTQGFKNNSKALQFIVYNVIKNGGVPEEWLEDSDLFEKVED